MVRLPVFLILALLAAQTTCLVAAIQFHEGYSPIFGGGNIVRSADGKSVQLKLDRYTGSGFISNHAYHHGFFSAAIKLPAAYTAGVVVAFYMSNSDVFEKNHDELDFEFLGNRWGGQWRIQTNVYGNGSTSRGREERYILPFDPTEEAHRYSILWTANNIIFYVDDIPIREVIRNEAMGGDYPSKPMSVYATIWDGSAWATEGGKYKVNYKYEPFRTDFSGFVLRGCPVSNIKQIPSIVECAEAELELMMSDYAIMTPKKRSAMRRFREKYMTYTICYDTLRYGTTFPECDNSVDEQHNFHAWGESKIVAFPPRRSRRRNRKAGSKGPRVTR